MGAKMSPEMQKAKALIEASGGKVTAYAAAQQFGLTTGAISRSAWYKKFIESLPADDKIDPHARARQLVVDQGYTAYAAAKVVGIDESTINRAPWYRLHMSAQKERMPAK